MAEIPKDWKIAGEGDSLRGRRIAKVGVTPEVLVLAGVRQAVRVKSSGVPVDATVVKVTYDEQRRCFWALIESKTLPPLEDGIEIPEVAGPIFEITY